MTAESLLPPTTLEGLLVTTTATLQPAETNLADVPLYTLLDVSRYLRLPIWSILQMTGQTNGHPEEWLFHHFHSRGAYAIADDIFPHSIAIGTAPRIPFRRLADLFVIAGVFYLLADEARSGVGEDDGSGNLFHKVWRGLQGIRHHRVFVEGESEEVRSNRTADQFAYLGDEDSAHLRKWLSLRIRIDL